MFVKKKKKKLSRWKVNNMRAEIECHSVCITRIEFPTFTALSVKESGGQNTQPVHRQSISPTLISVTTTIIRALA